MCPWQYFKCNVDEDLLYHSDCPLGKGWSTLTQSQACRGSFYCSFYFFVWASEGPESCLEESKRVQPDQVFNNTKSFGKTTRGMLKPTHWSKTSPSTHLYKFIKGITQCFLLQYQFLLIQQIVSFLLQPESFRRDGSSACPYLALESLQYDCP